MAAKKIGFPLAKFVIKKLLIYEDIYRELITNLGMVHVIYKKQENKQSVA